MVEVGTLEIGASMDTSTIEKGINKIKDGMRGIQKETQGAKLDLGDVGGSFAGIGGSLGPITAAIGALVGIAGMLSSSAIRDMFSVSSDGPIASAYSERKESLETRKDLIEDVSKIDVYQNQVENLGEEIDAMLTESGRNAQNAANTMRIAFDDFLNDWIIGFKTGFDETQSNIGSTMHMVADIFNPLEGGLIESMTEAITGIDYPSITGLFSNFFTNLFGGNNGAQSKKEANYSTPSGTGFDAFMSWFGM